MKNFLSHTRHKLVMDFVIVYKPLSPAVILVKPTCPSDHSTDIHLSGRFTVLFTRSLYCTNVKHIQWTTIIIIYPTVNGQSHRTIPTTWPYNILRYLYSCLWVVVIAQLSAVDLPCKVNDKSRWPRKTSEWGAGSVCM